MAFKCANNSCGKSFNLEENNDTACIHHSGSAVFHEGLKGWSCCKKRVISFEEFMDIPGCSCGAHVPEEKKAQPEPKKSPAPATPAPILVSSTSKPAPTPVPAPAKSAPLPPKEEDNDPADAVITPGTLCKRLGCNSMYHDERSKAETCMYLTLEIFHEGSKGYNCCKMVGDFDEFLRMPGCRKGQHKFLETKKEATNKVECRHDWYQMGPNVVVCVYAKGINKQQSSITFGPQTLTVELVLPEDKTYSKTFNLSKTIDPEKSKFEFLSTKTEIKLFKTDGSQWTTLE